MQSSLHSGKLLDRAFMDDEHAESWPPTPGSPTAGSLYHATTNIDDLTLALINYSRVPSPEPTPHITCCCGKEGCENTKGWLAFKTKLEGRLILSAGVHDSPLASWLVLTTYTKRSDKLYSKGMRRTYADIRCACITMSAWPSHETFICSQNVAVVPSRTLKWMIWLTTLTQE